MSAQFTPIGRGDGYYVHVDENGDAISVAASGVGPNGGWIGISIARMSVPDKYKTRTQINETARMFAAAPELYEALKDAQIIIKAFSLNLDVRADIRGVLGTIDAALSKARPVLTGGAE